MKTRYSRPIACALLSLVLAACIESNPQPSPSSPGGIGAKEVTESTNLESDAAAGSIDLVVDEDIPVSDHGVAKDAAPEDAAADVAIDLTGDMLPSEVIPPDAVTDTALDQAPGPMCELCQPPYPACAYIQGQWACVQCTDDSHCPGGCTCMSEIFSCMSCDPPPPNCSNDEECQEAQPGLLCDEAEGLCYDPAGWCGDFEVACKWDQGSQCVDLWPMPGVPAMPGTAKMCSCEDPTPLEDALACLATGDCQDQACWPGQVCVEMDMLCQSLFGDCPALFGGPVCIGPGFLESLPIPF